MNSRDTLQSEELQRAARTSYTLAHTVAAQNGGALVQVYTYIYPARGTALLVELKWRKSLWFQCSLLIPQSRMLPVPAVH